MKYKLSIINFPFSILLAAAFFAMPVHAQVSIGNNKVPPHSFSVLEISTDQLKGGLRLPQLTTTARENLLKTAADSIAAGGLVIYNTTNDCVELWSTDHWISMCNNTIHIVFTDPENPDVFIDLPATPFSGLGETKTLVPHNTPACTPTPPNSPYSVSIKEGGAFTSVHTIDAATGKFTLTMTPNDTDSSRYAIISVMDNCAKQEEYFIIIQNGPAVF